MVESCHGQVAPWEPGRCGGVSTAIDETRPNSSASPQPSCMYSPRWCHCSPLPGFWAGPFLSQLFSRIQRHYGIVSCCMHTRPWGGCKKELLTPSCNYSDGRLPPSSVVSSPHPFPPARAQSWTYFTSALGSSLLPFHHHLQGVELKKIKELCGLLD